MLKKWLLAGLLLDPDPAVGNAGDAGVSDGTDNAGGDAGDGVVADGSAAAGSNAGRDDTDDDDDEDDFSELSYKEDPQFKKVVKKLQKRNRQLQRLRPIATRVKDVDLDDVMTKAKSAEQIQNALAAHPDLAEQVMAALAGTRKSAATTKAEKAKFDRSKLPFSVDDESGKFFADFYEKFIAMQDELTATRTELNGLKQTGQTEKRAQVVATWQSQTKAAAAQVPDWARDMFNDAVYGAFREAESRRMSLDPQRVIKHYLSKLPIGDKAKAAAAAASAAKAATKNSNLPRVPSQSGVPAGARKAGETVKDVNRRIRAGGYFPR